MEKHLICLDLDGTLLSNQKEILPFTKKVLLELKAQGHILMIATGRPYRATEKYYNELSLNTPVVNFNGAFVHHPTDLYFKTVHETLDLQIAKDIIEELHDLKIQNVVAEVKDQVFIHYHDSLLIDEFSMGNPTILHGNLAELMDEHPTSILIQAEERHIKDIREHLTNIYAEAIEHRRWGDPFPVIELVKKGINKAQGIMYVKEKLDLNGVKTIAFGDEDNDLEMIKYADIGVAMHNGINDLKSVATHTTLSNEEDGIGHFLNDYFNLEMEE